MRRPLNKQTSSPATNTFNLGEKHETTAHNTRRSTGLVRWNIGGYCNFTFVCVCLLGDSMEYLMIPALIIFVIAMAVWLVKIKVDSALEEYKADMIQKIDGQLTKIEEMKLKLLTIKRDLEGK